MVGRPSEIAYRQGDSALVTAPNAYRQGLGDAWRAKSTYRQGAEDGLGVIEAARRLQPEALAVLVSGATGPEVLQRLRRVGVTLLTKPVAPARLRALLSTRRAVA